MDIKATIYTTTPISQKSKDFLADSLRSVIDTVKTIENEYTRTNPQHTKEWIDARVEEIHDRILEDMPEIVRHIMCTLSTLEDTTSPIQQSLVIYNYLLMKVCKSIDSDYSTHIMFNKNTMPEKLYMLSPQPCDFCDFPFKVRINSKAISTYYLRGVSPQCMKEYLTNFGIVRSTAEYIVTTTVIKKLLVDLRACFIYPDKLPINRYPIQ